MKTQRKTRQLADLFDTIWELLAMYAIVLVLAAGAFAVLEEKTFFDGLWWAAVTATTVGYGDMYPTTVGGKIVAFCLMHITLLLVLPIIIGHVCSKLIKDRNEFSHEEQEDIKRDLREIKQLLAQQGHNECKR